jgi:hypothetical protein
MTSVRGQMIFGLLYVSEQNFRYVVPEKSLRIRARVGGSIHFAAGQFPTGETADAGGMEGTSRTGEFLPRIRNSMRFRKA